MHEYTKSFIKEHFFELIMSIPKTIWFNFKVLPLQSAIKIPFVVSYKIRVKGVNKSTFTVEKSPLSTASMRIGFGDSATSRRESRRGVINIENGHITVGKQLGISQGCVIICKLFYNDRLHWI